MTAPIGVPPRLAEIEAELLAPGGPFATEEVEVLGERMQVFKNRSHDLRGTRGRAPSGFGDAEYFVFSDGVAERRITFAEHERLVASVAAALRDEYGVGPGDRVAILGANSPEWIVTFWATISLGCDRGRAQRLVDRAGDPVRHRRLRPEGARRRPRSGSRASRARIRACPSS